MATEHKGKTLIHDLCQNSTDSVHDMSYTKSHLAKTQENCLQEADQEKKKMCLEACLQQCQHFPFFVTYFVGLLGVEAVAALKSIVSRLTTNCQQPYFMTCEKRQE